jgi:hypothetical protein
MVLMLRVLVQRQRVYILMLKVLNILRQKPGQREKVLMHKAEDVMLKDVIRTLVEYYLKVKALQPWLKEKVL